MDTKNTYADGFGIRVASGLCCPHCDNALAPQAVQHYAPDAWRVTCGSCHGDVIVIEPVE